jgi:metal-responsive CopG/Arc/MetJ family transcriptional regulator
MQRTQIQLTDEQSQALKALAAERRISVAELIRQAAEDLLRQSSTLSKAEMKQRALAAAGRFRSGQKDLSTRHDDHLAEIYGE